MKNYKGYSKLKIILFFSLALNAVAVFFVARRLYLNYSSINQPSLEKIYWLYRKELFEVLPKDSSSILFLGNSLTDRFELAELFKNLTIKNRGISGDNVPGVLNRLTSIVSTQPKKIFIEIGINDLAKGVSGDTVISNYKRLLDTLQNKCKKTKFYIQSLLPVANSSRWLASYTNPEVNKNIKEVNKQLKALAGERDITFIDIYSKFVISGKEGDQINPKYTVDGVHLSGEAYLHWKTILQPYVDE